ncbi:MAG: methionyl-tRNA synthetase, partial [Planctomycetota bacterium]
GMNLIRKVDGFIQTTAPFKLAKDDGRRDELGAILYQCLEAIRIASLLLWPTLNHKMEQLWDVFGLEMNPRDGKLAELAQWGGLPVGGSVVKVALFPRIDAPQA